MKHVYVRRIDPEANDSLAVIVRCIPAQKKVLDVGTGSGALGQYLQVGGACVDGITYSEEEALQAAPYYRRIEKIDLEQVLPSARFAGQSYDVIVCADILEHIRNAAEVLADLRKLLAPGGRLLLSIPNATYMGVLFSLLAGCFTRTREGLLDATHVNFFDRQGLSQLVKHAGFDVAAELNVRKGMIESEFGALDTLAFPAAVREYVPLRPDAGIYQFVWELVAASEAIASADGQLPPKLPSIEVVPQFAAQTFWDEGNGFEETLSAEAYGELIDSPQTLYFNVALSREPKRLRLDFADRPGVFEFFAFRLLNANGEEIGCWKGDWTPELLLNDCLLLPELGLSGGRLMRATGGDPWVMLPARPAWRDACRAELRMTAPQPYNDAAFLWAERRYSERIARLEAEKTHLMETNHASALECAALNSKSDALVRRITTMETSLSWRMTAWLRWLSHAMRKP